MSSLESLFREWYASLEKEYIKRTPKSRAVFERARKVLPGGVTYQIRYFRPYPFYVVKAKGSRVWDVDGNVYDDYWMGHGTHVLGHAPDFVLEEVTKKIVNGTHIGLAHELEVEFAELLTKVIPGAEMIRFCNSGTEAAMYAIRLARAYAGRKKIVKMEGGWHGGSDTLHTALKAPYKGPDSAGLPEDSVKHVIAVPFNDIEALEETLRNEDVAAVIMEPVMGVGGCIPPKDNYLKEVRNVTLKHDVVLIFDEVITGFRLALGGAQEYFNVKADIVVLGKAVGGGFPGAGAIAARAEIMEFLDHLKVPDPKKRAFHGGTFTGNTVTLAAGQAYIRYLERHRGLYEEFNSTWEQARRELQKACLDSDVECYITGAGSMTGIHFTKEEPLNHYMSHYMRWSHEVYNVMHMYFRLRNIIYLSEEVAHVLPSMVHSKEQVKHFVGVFREFIEEVSKILKRSRT